MAPTEPFAHKGHEGLVHDANREDTESRDGAKLQNILILLCGGTMSEATGSEQKIHWTNASVLRMAGHGDPIATIQRLARDKTLQAIDAGWSGPPFNPIQLADFLRIRVDPKASVADARTVSDANGLRIEFNPTQSRGRLRFSIAHEVAHCLFPDVAEAVRYRGPEPSGDAWQLEMLCNIAAAEFIMPVGSLPSLDTLPTIEKLMEVRRKFDVSTEAFLIRATKVAQDPVLMFCASPIGEGSQAKGYRLDYVVQSRSWVDPVPSTVDPAIAAMFSSCTAIGFTVRSTEGWGSLENVSVEAVGIPPYPGERLPRIAGVIRSGAVAVHTSPAFEYKHGNVLSPGGGEGIKIIGMLTNDTARQWGGGVARQAAKRFPNAQRGYSAWISSLPAGERLGQVYFGRGETTIIIAALVAQKGLGPSEFPRIRYTALESCLRQLAEEAIRNRATVHLPRIGLGEARGSWDIVEEMLFEELIDRGVKTIVYDLPPKRAEAPEFQLP